MAAVTTMRPPRLLVTSCQRSAGAVRVAVVGELDHCGGDDLRTHVADVLPDRLDVLELDLARLEFMDAAGIRALVRIERDVAERGGRVVIIAVRAEIERLLRIVDLADLLSVPQRPDQAHH